MPHHPSQYGTMCRIGPYTYWGEQAPPSDGCYLASKAGSWYFILEARSIAGNPNRLRLLCQRTNPAEVPVGATVYCIEWSAR
jgi:hypothetical protein